MDAFMKILYERLSLEIMHDKQHIYLVLCSSYCYNIQLGNILSCFLILQVRASSTLAGQMVVLKKTGQGIGFYVFC